MDALFDNTHIDGYDSDDDTNFDPDSQVSKKVKRDARPKCCCAAYCRGNSDSSKLFRLPKAPQTRAGILRYLRRDNAFIDDSAGKDLLACFSHFKAAVQTHRNQPYEVTFYTVDERLVQDPVLAEIYDYEPPHVEPEAEAPMRTPIRLLRRDVVDMDPNFGQHMVSASPIGTAVMQKRRRVEERSKMTVRSQYKNQDPVQLGEEIEKQKERL